MLEIIGRLAGKPLTVRREPAQKGDMRDTYADTTLARADLGFAPTVSLERGTGSGVSMAFDHTSAADEAARIS